MINIKPFSFATRTGPGQRTILNDKGRSPLTDAGRRYFKVLTRPDVPNIVTRQQRRRADLLVAKRIRARINQRYSRA